MLINTGRLSTSPTINVSVLFYVPQVYKFHVDAIILTAVGTQHNCKCDTL
jgi:hypothetical protein